jgi:hypothetical protein
VAAAASSETGEVDSLVPGVVMKEPWFSVTGGLRTASMSATLAPTGETMSVLSMPVVVLFVIIAFSLPFAMLAKLGRFKGASQVAFSSTPFHCPKLSMAESGSSGAWRVCDCDRDDV